MKPAGTYLHFEGTYRGVYRGGKVTSAAGTHTFKELDWVWLEVTPVTRLAARSVQEERVLDFYFAPPAAQEVDVSTAREARHACYIGWS